MRCPLSQVIYIGLLLTGGGCSTSFFSRLVAAAKGGWGRRSRRPGNFSTPAIGRGRARHRCPGFDAVRPRRRRVMSTERHRWRMSCAATPSSEVDGAVGFPPVGRRVNRVLGVSRRHRRAGLLWRQSALARVNCSLHCQLDLTARRGTRYQCCARFFHHCKLQRCVKKPGRMISLRIDSNLNITKKDDLVQPQVQALVRHEPPQQRVRVRVQGVVRRVLAQTQKHLAHHVDVGQDAHDALDEGPQ